MKLFRAFGLFLLTTLTLASCFDDPDFGVAPRITNVDVQVKQATETQDSLIVRVEFEDGDGDLGFFQGEEGEPYFRIPNPNTGEPYWLWDENDTSLPPFNCRDYRDVPLTEGDTIIDTIRVEYNEAYFNYSIDVYTKEDGQYEEFDFLTEENGCTAPLGGRFFNLRDDFNTESPLQGTIQWAGVDFYNLYFRNDTLQLRVTIRDRAGNVSNTFSSEDFTLAGKRQGVIDEG